MKIFNKIASLFMLAAAFTVSCSEGVSEESFEVPVDSSRNITFSVTLPDTKGSVVTNSTFNEFSVYATYSAYPTLATRVMSINSNGMWTLNSTLSMPTEGSITFYAVGCQNGTGVSFDQESGAVDYEMPSDIASQPSILMSFPITLEQDELNLDVNFSFNHVLAAVGFKTGTGDYTLTGIEISNFYADATIAFADSYSTACYTLGDKTNASFASASVEDSANNYYMIPAQNMEGVTYKAYFTYYDEAGTAVDTYVKESTLAENSDTETLGMVYTYSISSKDYVAPDVITPGKDYEDTDNDGAFELEDMVVGDDQEIDVDSNSTLTWASSDESVVTVDSEGVVTAIGGGTAKITATSATDGVVVEFEVTVYDPITGLNLSGYSLTMTVGTDTSTLTTTAKYGATNNPEDYTISFSSSSTSIATVSTNGVVTPVAAGSAVISATITGSVSGRIYSTSYTVTVAAASFYNYGDLSIGQYVKSDGSISDSSSGAVAVIYYVASDYALAASLTITKTTQWCPSSYTSSYIYATSTTDGYSNSAKMYAQSSTSSSSTNPVYYAKYKGTISGAYDGNGKGEFYLPSRCEAYLFISKFFSGTSITMSETAYTTTFSGTKSSLYNNNSVYGSIAYIVTSTEVSSTQCNIVSGDGSGATTAKLKDSYKNLSTSTWAPTVYIVPIVKL